MSSHLPIKISQTAMYAWKSMKNKIVFESKIKKEKRNDGKNVLIMVK